MNFSEDDDVLNDISVPWPASKRKKRSCKYKMFDGYHNLSDFVNYTNNNNNNSNNAPLKAKGGKEKIQNYRIPTENIQFLIQLLVAALLVFGQAKEYKVSFQSIKGSRKYLMC